MLQISRNIITQIYIILVNCSFIRECSLFCKSSNFTLIQFVLNRSKNLFRNLRIMHKILSFLFLTISLLDLNAQYPGWQQSVKYVMSVELDSLRHTYKGVQQLTYFNNSPDTIKDAYFHLYNNAFQPGSMMDIRSRTISDPDRRVGDRIQYLTPEEQGFLHVTEILMNDKKCQTTEHGTILKVDLPAWLLFCGLQIELHWTGSCASKAIRT